MTIQEQLGITRDELDDILVEKLIKLSTMVGEDKISSTNAKIVFNDVYSFHRQMAKALQQEAK